MSDVGGEPGKGVQSGSKQQQTGAEGQARPTRVQEGMVLEQNWFWHGGLHTAQLTRRWLIC